MLSLHYSIPGDDNVLDLCTRKGEKRCADPENLSYVPERKRSRSSSPMGGLDLCSRDSDQRHHEYASENPTDYSATVAVIQQRLYPDEASLEVSPDQGNCALSPESHHHYEPPPACEYIGLAAQVSTSTMCLPPKGKATRPFKAYPKNPLTLATPSVDGLLTDTNRDYEEFRRRMLEQVHATHGSTTNKNMKRPVPSSSPSQLSPSSSMDPSKDSAYWERRRKNNEAAKRSRDARRAKEDELAIRAAFLEQENVKLKYEVAALRNETNRLRCMLFTN